MAEFYSACSETITPLPWQTFAPPLTAAIISGISLEAGRIIGIVAVVAGGIAVIKPLPQIGLGHRGFAFLFAFLIGAVGLRAAES